MAEEMDMDDFDGFPADDVDELVKGVMATVLEGVDRYNEKMVPEWIN